MSKISHKHTYCVCLCKSANDISLGEDMPNSSNKITIMNCAKGVSLITVKNGCDSLIYVAKLKEIKDSNTDCRYRWTPSPPLIAKERSKLSQRRTQLLHSLSTIGT